MAKRGEKMLMLILKAGTSNKSKQPTSGFTLPELLVVLIIIGTMTSILTLSIHFGNSSSDVNTAIRRVSDAVAEARSRALLRRTPLELRINENKLELFQREPESERISVTQLPDGVHIDNTPIDGKSSRKSLFFNSKGITQPATIRLNAKGTLQEIVIRPILGVNITKNLFHVEQKETTP